MKYGSIIIAVALMIGVNAYGETGRHMETTGRALTVTETADHSRYLSWRLLADDPADIAFDIIRIVDGEREKITDKPVKDTTDFLDSARIAAGKKADYELHAVSGGRTVDVSKPVAESTPFADGTAVRSFKITAGSAERIGFGDLDGDGNLDFVIKQPGDFGVDPYYKSWIPSIHPYFLEAYRHDGTFLWRYEMGWSIETGTWYSPYAVYDLDGDGCAEVAVKASDGDYRNEEGHVWSGPEYLAILDGKTGETITRTDWVSREPWVDAFGPEWGYEYSSRHQIMIAYLNGETPSVVIQRGTYDINILCAYDYRDGTLTKRWTWDNRGESKEYYGQSSHTIIPADVDSDGRDELVIGSVALDDDGSSLWSTGQEHTDACYVSDFDPRRPGLEVYYGCEMHREKNGVCLADALTGSILWGIDVPTKHVHSYGLAGDVIADLPGSEFYGRDRETPGGAWFLDSKGNEIAEAPFTGQIIYTVYWDADCQREIIRGGIVNYGEKKPVGTYTGDLRAVIDISGDWREEIITSEDGRINIFSTAIPAKDRRATLISDPIYRLNAIGFTSGYWHSLMLSYDMASSAQ